MPSFLTKQEMKVGVWLDSCLMSTYHVMECYPTSMALVQAFFIWETYLLQSWDLMTYASGTSMLLPLINTQPPSRKMSFCLHKQHSC